MRIIPSMRKVEAVLDHKSDRIIAVDRVGCLQRQ